MLDRGRAPLLSASSFMRWMNRPDAPSPAALALDEQKPVQIRVEKDLLVRVEGVEPQQVLVEAEGPQLGRIDVRRLRGEAEEFRGRGQGGGIGLDDEGVLGKSRGLLARGVEFEGLEGDEIVERRAQGRDVARLEEAGEAEIGVFSRGLRPSGRPGKGRRSRETDAAGPRS